jgi:hypothetical protein
VTLKIDALRCPTRAELSPPPLGENQLAVDDRAVAPAAGPPDGSPWPRISAVTPSYNY